MATTWKQYANNAHSTLAVGIDTDDTELTLADASSFPATDDFWITVHAGDYDAGEIMLVTATPSGNTFPTVTRAQQSTTATAWAAGAFVELLWTKSDVDAITAAITGIEAGTTTLASVTATGTLTSKSVAIDLASPTTGDYLYYDGSKVAMRSPATAAFRDTNPANVSTTIQQASTWHGVQNSGLAEVAVKGFTTIASASLAFTAVSSGTGGLARFAMASTAGLAAGDIVTVNYTPDTTYAGVYAIATVTTNSWIECTGLNFDGAKTGAGVINKGCGLRATAAGTYFIFFGLSCRAAAASAFDAYLAVYQNTSTVLSATYHTMSSTQEKNQVVLETVQALSAGDRITLNVQNVTNTTAFNVLLQNIGGFRIY